MTKDGHYETDERLQKRREMMWPLFHYGNQCCVLLTAEQAVIQSKDD